MSDGYLIGPDFLGRIRRVVDDAESMPMRVATRPIPVRLEGEEASGTGELLRLCKTTECFPKGSMTDLQLWENAPSIESGPTLPFESSSGTVLRNVRNLYANIAANRLVSVAKHANGYYYVISADLT